MSTKLVPPKVQVGAVRNAVPLAPIVAEVWMLATLRFDRKTLPRLLAARGDADLFAELRKCMIAAFLGAAKLGAAGHEVAHVAWIRADSFRKLALRKTVLLEDCQERLSAFCWRQVCLAIRCDAGEFWQCNLGTVRTSMVDYAQTYG